MKNLVVVDTCGNCHEDQPLDAEMEPEIDWIERYILAEDPLEAFGIWARAFIERHPEHQDTGWVDLALDHYVQDLEGYGLNPLWSAKKQTGHESNNPF